MRLIIPVDMKVFEVQIGRRAAVLAEDDCAMPCA